MPTVTKSDKQLLELILIYRKLSTWNKFLVYSFALRALIKKRIDSYLCKIFWNV
jgi:hypothetical protein